LKDYGSRLSYLIEVDIRVV